MSGDFEDYEHASNPVEHLLKLQLKNERLIHHAAELSILRQDLEEELEELYFENNTLTQHLVDVRKAIESYNDSLIPDSYTHDDLTVAVNKMAGALQTFNELYEMPAIEQDVPAEHDGNDGNLDELLRILYRDGKDKTVNQRKWFHRFYKPAERFNREDPWSL